MSHIKYNFGAIEGAATDIRSSASRIGSQLEDLKSQLAPMVSTWEGEASVSYQVAQEKWDRAAAELNTILNTIAHTVSEGNARMDGINRHAANSWG